MPTQLPSVPSLIPSSFATLAIGRDVSITIFTASSLNSGEKLFFGRGKTFTFPDVHPIGWTVRKARGTSIAGQADRIAQLERRLGRDSSSSSKPPSSDSPYTKKSTDRSLREKTGRKPGKQPGAPGRTLGLSDDPDETIECAPAECGRCGRDLTGEPAARTERRRAGTSPRRPRRTSPSTGRSPRCARAVRRPVPGRSRRM